MSEQSFTEAAEAPEAAEVPPSMRRIAARTRFVTLCQQMLALAVVLAVLTPAARTVTMDVRPMPLDGSAAPGAFAAGGVGLAAYVKATVTPSRVAAAPTNAHIANYALTAPRGARLAQGGAGRF